MKKIFPIFFSIFLIPAPLVAHAAILPPCTATGNCGICDMMLTINAIMRWITIVAGSIALLWFVWGGLKFITAGGRMDQVTAAKKIFTNTIIGVLIVFVAWTGVNLIITQIAGSQNVLIYSAGQAQTWYNICAQGEGQNECFSRGDGYPCGGGKGHCEKNTCENGSACAWLASQPAYIEYGYKCQAPEACGITYNDCDTAPNCLKNLCPGGASSVCCFKK